MTVPTSHSPTHGVKPFSLRVFGGLSRRAAAWRTRRTAVPASHTAEAALDWLAAQARDASLSESYPSASSANTFCPALTGGCLATAWSYGEEALAEKLLAQLLAHQHNDGGFAAGDDATSSLLTTAHASAGLAAMAEHQAAAREALARAASWIAARIDERGQFILANRAAAADRWTSPLERLVCLPPLSAAGILLDQPSWRAAAARAIDAATTHIDWLAAAGESFRALWGIEALAQMGRLDLAQEALRFTAATQQRNGTVPAAPQARWYCSPGMALLAGIWYRLGHRTAGDAALAALHRQQRSDGSLPGSWGRNAGYYPRQAATWAVKHYLDAALLQVQCAFAAGPAGVIADPCAADDGRMQAVLRCCAALSGGSKILDAGCGDGRYLRQLSAKLPHLQLTGIDTSAEMLEHLPPQIEWHRGHLLRLPLADAQFDVVLAVEVLEHALVPRRAVAELCRVVRPGGTVLIIDKRRSRQSLSHHEPWERWFEADDLSGLLRPHCDDVSVRSLSHGSPPRGGLFLAWQGTVRSAAAMRRVA